MELSSHNMGKCNKGRDNKKVIPLIAIEAGGFHLLFSCFRTLKPSNLALQNTAL